MKEKVNDRISSLMETAMKNLTSMVDVNTIMGSAVKAEDGKYIIPISKVTVAFMTGAGEYGKVKIFNKNDELPFAGGSGAILSLKPSGFLVGGNGDNYKIIPMDKEPLEKLYDIAEEYFNSLRKEENS